MMDRVDVLARVDLGELLVKASGREGRNGSWPCPVPAHEQTGATPPVKVSVAQEGYGLWHCHGCGAGGTAVDVLTLAHGLSVADAFAELRDNTLGPAAPRPKAKAKPPEPLPTMAQIGEWANELQARPAILDRLEAIKGWTPGALAVFDVGWNGERLTLPVYDRHGSLVNLLRYLPNGNPKMVGLRGRHRDLWPSPEVLAMDETEAELVDVFIVEGETDAIAAASCNVCAVAVPGANAWKTEWADRFDGMRVRVLTDYDERGRELADAVTADLSARGACRELQRVEWPDVLGHEPPEGYDLGDHLLLKRRAPTDRGVRP